MNKNLIGFVLVKDSFKTVHFQEKVDSGITFRDPAKVNKNILHTFFPQVFFLNSAFFFSGQKSSNITFHDQARNSIIFLNFWPQKNFQRCVCHHSQDLDALHPPCFCVRYIKGATIFCDRLGLNIRACVRYANIT